MGPTIATAGLSIQPATGRMDFTPLLTVLAVLLVVRLVLKVGLTWPLIGIAFLVGNALAWAIQAWGVVYPSAVAFALAAIVTAPLHRRGRRRPGEA
jgi:hypothetical protein